MNTLNMEKLTNLRSKIIEYLKKAHFDKVMLIENEEQTKNWIILPFLSALGYDTQSSEVVPEVTADFSKKGEKVDYMLQVDNVPVALIECKKFGAPLEDHIGQLYRYFATKDIHLGILTNGIEYWFFTDSKKENVMDKSPYLKFNVAVDNFSILSEYTRENIMNACIPSVENARKQLEKQKEQEIGDYKTQINRMQEKINNQKEKLNSAQIYSAMLVRQLLKTEKLEKENKRLKEKTALKKEKQIYGGGALDKHKVPADIARDMVELLPEDVFVPEAKFFDPFCRHGELLMAIKDRLMQSKAMQAAFPDEDDRAEYIGDNQLYAFVIDEQGLKTVTRKIHGTSNPRNPHVTQFGSEESYYNGTQYGIGSFTMEKLKELRQMKFDVVVGNPPYNSDIYLDFVQLGHVVSTKYSLFITPSKWQAKGGKKNEAFRKNIVPYMSDIVYYPDCREVFDIGETAGVCYYLLNKSNVNETEVTTICNRNPVFNGRTTLDKNNLLFWDDSIKSIINKCRDTRMMCDTLSFSFRYFVKERTWGEGTGDVDLMVGENCVGKVNSADLDHREDVGKYKCTTSATYGFAMNNSGFSVGCEKINILKPNEVPRNPSVVLKCFDTLAEAESFRSYIYSKLVSFLFILGISGTSFRDVFWRFVPDPGTFDHIFTDEELYKKYNLTPAEIHIIESVIKDRK